LVAAVFTGALIACGPGEQPPPNTGGNPTSTSTATTPPTTTAPTTTTTATSTATTPPTTTATATAPTASGTGTATPPPAPMTAIRASQMGAELQQIGLDPKKLPPLNKLEPAKLRKVMNTFTKALGVQCTKCHADDFKAPTPNKKIAAKMWNDFVVGMQMEDGSQLYCDSCHQGKDRYLDHKDKRALSAWMQDNFVNKLKRTDKKNHGCETCHGDPFDGDFLEKWKK
jgi:hypothetical protein